MDKSAEIIKFDKISKKFGVMTALEDISFLVNEGDFVFITGPSGSGKTTLLKLILCETRPTSGMLEIFGTNIAKISRGKITQFRRKIGVVFQDFKLLSDRMVFENIAMPLEVVGIGSGDIKTYVSEIIDLVGLTGKEKLFPAQLAGGEMQRTCLARAVVSKPKILLADEPTGNLDPATSWQIMKLIKKINKMGTTVLMATHNVDIVNSMNQRVIILDKGRVKEISEQGKYHTV